jgi:hypothetical protein
MFPILLVHFLHLDPRELIFDRLAPTDVNVG